MTISRIVTASAASLALFSLMTGVAHAAGTLDQHNDAPSNSGVTPVSVDDSYGQTFTAGITGALTDIEVVIRTSSATSALTVQLFNSAASVPTGTALATTSLPVASIPASFAWTDIAFPSPAQVISGNSYVLVFTSTSAGANSIDMDLTAGGYSGGVYIHQYQATGWHTMTGNESRFRTYVQTSTGGDTPPPVMQQFGMPTSGTCDAAAPIVLNWGGASSGSWGNSWAQWANGGKGGAVCTRTLNYSNALGRWVAS